MPASLMSSKLQPPPSRQELVARPRILERLTSDLWNGEVFTRKVTLICASAGSGKTTLAAGWLHQSNYPCAWLSLDEKEGDPSRFLSYLIGALMQVDEGLGGVTWQALQNPQPPPFAELLASLVSEITAYGKPLVLALDDYHIIQATAVHQQTNFLIEYQPHNLHLVIITREDPPIPVSRLRARGQLLEVRQGDLRFSPEECSRFLVEAMGLKLSGVQVAALARRTEGWVVGLQLAALALRGVTDPQTFIQSFTGSHRYILDYLLDEVLNRQPDAIQQFLLKTSILERLSGPLCDAVTGQKGGAAQLSALDAANLFILPLDQTRTWYRYHRLFAELLRHRLQLQLEVDEKSLHQAASRWYEDNQYPQEAVQHALAAENWSRAGELICQQSEALLKNGELTTLIDWCQCLPEAVLCADARLCLAYAWPLLLRSQPEPAAHWLDQAENLAGENTPLLGEIAAAQAYLAQIQGDGARLVVCSEQALALLPRDRLSHRSVVALNLGIAYWHMGRIEAADKALAEALHAGLATGNHYASLTARIFLARSLAVRSQLRMAQEQLLEILKLPARPPIMTLVFLDLATLEYEWNHLARAEEYLDQGLQAAKISGNPEFQIAALLLQARLSAAQGRRGSALEAIQAAENIVSTGKIPARTQERIEVLKSELSLGIAPTLQERQPLPDNIDAHPFYRFLGLGEIRRLLAQGHKAGAAARLANLEEAASRAGWVYGLVVLHILQALAAGSNPAAVEALRKALDLAQPQDFIRSFVDAGAQLIPILQQAAREGVHPLYIGEILAAFQAKPTPLSAAGSASQPGSATFDGMPMEALSERELEVLHLMAAGMSNRQIASQLVLSLGTVKTHLHNIYGKLEARNRPQAVDRARELELL